MSKIYKNFGECKGKEDITIFEVRPSSGEIIRVNDLHYSEYTHSNFNGTTTTFIALEKSNKTYVSGIEVEEYKNKNAFKEMNCLGCASVFLSLDDALNESTSIINERISEFNEKINELTNLNEKMHKFNFKIL